MEKNNIYIEEIVKKQRMYFAEGRTLAVRQRMEALKKLEQGILNCEQELYAALKKDLGKSNFESYMCETGLVLSEITHMLKNIRFQIAMGKKVLYR